MMEQGIRQTTPAPQAVQLGDALFALEVETAIYGLDAILRACYRFTDICYLFLARCDGEPERITVSLSSKSPGADGTALLGEFCNELIDQRLRGLLANEAGALRELIVAQAFAEGNLLDPQRDDGDYQTDPLGIGRRR